MGVPSKIGLTFSGQTFNSLMKYVGLLVGIPGCAVCAYFLANKVPSQSEVKVIEVQEHGGSAGSGSGGFMKSLNNFGSKIVPQIPQVSKRKIICRILKFFVL